MHREEKKRWETRYKMSEETTLLDAVTVVVECGLCKDREALGHDVLRALLQGTPELREAGGAQRIPLPVRRYSTKSNNPYVPGKRSDSDENRD
jgi:hypothetical protein